MTHTDAALAAMPPTSYPPGQGSSPDGNPQAHSPAAGPDAAGHPSVQDPWRVKFEKERTRSRLMGLVAAGAAVVAVVAGVWGFAQSDNGSTQMGVPGAGQGFPGGTQGGMPGGGQAPGIQGGMPPGAPGSTTGGTTTGTTGTP